jgi:hypothetical protein
MKWNKLYEYPKENLIRMRIREVNTINNKRRETL